MTNRCIANELMALVPRAYLLSLVSECAKGLGYYATPIFPDDERLPAKIGIYAIDKSADNYGSMAEAGTVLVTPMPPNMRIQVFCQVWQSSISFDPGFTPCEVGAEVVRYLLRMLEGHVRANAWHPPWEKSDELSELQKPIDIKTNVSALANRVNEYRLDNNLSIGFFQLSDGRIQINQEWAGGAQGALIGFDGEKLDGGQIRLTPYLNDAARVLPAAVEDLRRLCSAIEGAAGIETQVNQNERNRGSDHWTYPTFEERADIVKEYRRARSEGEVVNKDGWAQTKYQISGRTLKRYEDEYDLKTDT